MPARTERRSVLDSHRQLLGELSRTRIGLDGDLRIIASTTPGSYLVPGLVARFCERHPLVRPSIRIADSGEVIEALRAQRWEIGFTGLRPPDRELQSRAVGEDEIVLAVHHTEP